jgi:hypothetical protein
LAAWGLSSWPIGDLSMRDRRKRWNYDPENYQVTGWLLIIVIISFVAVVLLKWYFK